MFSNSVHSSGGQTSEMKASTRPQGHDSWCPWTFGTYCSICATPISALIIRTYAFHVPDPPQALFHIRQGWNNQRKHKADYYFLMGLIGLDFVITFYTGSMLKKNEHLDFLFSGVLFLAVYD